MRPPFHSSIVRLGVRPDEPAAVVGPRRRGSRGPHTDGTVAAVRRLIEQSVLTYSEIAARSRPNPAAWVEQVCAENITWYPFRDADVPLADKRDF